MSGSGINGQPVDDQQILKRIAVGDRQALSELYVRYQRPLFNYLLQLTPDYGLAEELLQDTLIAVWKSARSFEGRSNVLTWLIALHAGRHTTPCASASCHLFMKGNWKGWRLQSQNLKISLLPASPAMNW